MFVGKKLPSLLVFAATAALLLVSGCNKPAESTVANTPPGEKPLTKVVMQTDWFAQAEHGGFYQALAKGYYREAGLDVEIRQGGPNAMVAQKIATGAAQFAMGRSDDVLIAHARGIPVVMLGAFMQRDPQALMFHQSTGIKTFQDLNGRNVMALAGSAFIPIIEQTYKIKLSVTQLDYGLSRFLADKNLVQQCFITNEPFYIRQQGVDLGVLLLSDTGFSPYRVFYGRKDFIDKNPEVTRAFTLASLRGWFDYITGDPSPANEKIAALNPKMTPEFIAFSIDAMKSYKLVTGDPANGEKFGVISRERIARQIEQLTSIGQLDRPLTVDDVLNTSFSTPPPAATAAH